MSSMAAFANLGAVSEPTDSVLTPSMSLQPCFEVFHRPALTLGLAVRRPVCMELQMTHLYLQYAFLDPLPQLFAE